MVPRLFFLRNFSVRHSTIREVCKLRLMQTSGFFKLRLDDGKKVHDGLHEPGPVACLVIMHPQSLEDQRDQILANASGGI